MTVVKMTYGKVHFVPIGFARSVWHDIQRFYRSDMWLLVFLWVMARSNLTVEDFRDLDQLGELLNIEDLPMLVGQERRSAIPKALCDTGFIHNDRIEFMHRCVVLSAVYIHLAPDHDAEGNECYSITVYIRPPFDSIN